MSPAAALTFPDDFTFGVATAAYQVEGHIENDWSVWERAGKLTNKDARNGRGCEHWTRFHDDIQLIRDLSATAYRLSIEWARVEPKRGHWDDAAWQGYRERFEALRKWGIRPIVTLHHFTHPQWFHDETPWHDKKCLASWERYVRKCAECLEGLDAAIITLNEPNVLLLGGYLSGLMPPGLADGKKAFEAMANMCRAHAIARAVFKERWKDAPLQMGISQNVVIFAPFRRWHPMDQALTRLGDTNYNHAILDALHTGTLKLQMPGLTAGKAPVEGGERSMDFVGVNYYTRAHLRFKLAPPYVDFTFLDKHKRGLTDIGWEYYPEGFGFLLRSMKRYELPVWVTENGLDDRGGNRRPQHLFDHLRELLLARADGVNVTTYLHWSLMDNFEWLEAWGPRFGLYHVDFETMERKATPACDYYKTIATGRVLVPPPGAEPQAT